MSNDLNLDSFDITALTLARPSPADLDQISLQIAKGYLKGIYSFSDADSVMNNIYVYVVHNNLFAETGSITWSIYDAFDAGECYHRWDDQSEEPELKYTKPMLEIAFKKYGDCQLATPLVLKRMSEDKS